MEERRLNRKHEHVFGHRSAIDGSGQVVRKGVSNDEIYFFPPASYESGLSVERNKENTGQVVIKDENQ